MYAVIVVSSEDTCCRSNQRKVFGFVYKGEDSSVSLVACAYTYNTSVLLIFDAFSDGTFFLELLKQVMRKKQKMLVLNLI